MYKREGKEFYNQRAMTTALNNMFNFLSDVSTNDVEGVSAAKNALKPFADRATTAGYRAGLEDVWRLEWTTSSDNQTDTNKSNAQHQY